MASNNDDLDLKKDRSFDKKICIFYFWKVLKSTRIEEFRKN